MSTEELPSWDPRSFQVDGVKLGISQACAGFLLRPGMGKTTIIYAIIQILKNKGLMKRALVIAPIKPMFNVWPRQKNQWRQFTNLTVSVAHGKNRLEALYSQVDIVVINPEGLEWLEFYKDYVRDNFDILVVDESTKFKNTATQRFKRIRTIVRWFKRRYILTGSFTPNGLLNLFGQIYILDEGRALGRYITHYKNTYFYATDHTGFNLAPFAWAPKAIADRIAALTLVLEREGNIEMPELLPPNDIYVDLPATVRAKYDAMEDYMLTMLDDKQMVIAANAAVASSKCRQIANGGLYTNAGAGEWEDIHNVKLEALEDLIDQLSGENLLVVYEWNFDKEKLQKAFPTALLLTSGNPKKDDNAISLFASGAVPLALAQVSSISLGIDGLQQGCSNICMYGITWNLQDYSQTIDRVWRPGQKSSVVSVHRIIATNTVDERVAKVLESKDASQTSFLTILREMREERGLQ